MVKCNQPYCWDDMCEHPYPNEPGYSQANAARYYYLGERERLQADYSKLELELKKRKDAK